MNVTPESFSAALIFLAGLVLAFVLVNRNLIFKK